MSTDLDMQEPVTDEQRQITRLNRLINELQGTIGALVSENSSLKLDLNDAAYTIQMMNEKIEAMGRVLNAQEAEMAMDGDRHVQYGGRTVHESRPPGYATGEGDAQWVPQIPTESCEEAGCQHD